MKQSHGTQILAVLLLVFIVCGILLTPLGFETRASAVLSNPASLPWLGLAFGGLILIIVSLIVVFFRARIASILATIGSVGSAVLFLADQAGLVVSTRPPPLITAVEIVTTAVIVAILFFASRVYSATGLGLDETK